jgi:hypothetical protein
MTPSRVSLAALCAAAFAWSVAAQEAARTPPRQPIPYSHKLHAGDQGLECKMCHPNPDPGESMTIVGPSACMDCHAAIKTESPAIQQLAAYAKNGREVPWVRVYQIPSYVVFSHRTHLAKKNTCEECHGKVAEREQLYRETDLSMNGCMGCHGTKKTSNDCTLCHQLEPPQ